MRICLTAHGLPPHELAGVENHVDALARALGRAGHRVEVFAPRRDSDLPDRSLRREVRDGYTVTWVQVSGDPQSPGEALDPPGIAEAFAGFLDRERPEVVHVHHVVRIGLGVLDAAAAAGIPLVFTAHDYFATGDRYTLLRPDMRPINGAQTPELQTRCELATALLNRHAESLGDYHVGVFPGDVEPELARQLSALLDGDVAAAGVGAAEWEGLLARRVELERRRHGAFSQVDRFIAPTRFLRAKLIGAGYPEGAIAHQPYGIELERFRDLPPVRTGPGETLRVGYIGSLTKHKGVHVLLDAFELLEPAVRATVRLELYGDSTDRVYVERIAARAEALGASWHGAFLEPRLPELLAQLDVVVVPSLWYENYPFVIREAFAARRLVVASDGGALPESVRDGVDGLLFERGSAAALAASLTKLVRHPELRAELVAAAPAVRSIDDQARECAEFYQALVRAAAERRADDLEHGLRNLRAVTAARDALVALPMRDLLAQVLGGVDDLEQQLGARPPELSAALCELLGRDLRTPERLRDGAAEIGYVRRELAGRDEALASRAAELDWAAEQSDAAGAERDWLREAQASAAEELEWLRGQRASLEAAAKAHAEEAQWLRGELAARDEALDQRVEQVEWLEGEVREREERAAEQYARADLLEGERMRFDAHLYELSQRVESHRAAADALERRVSASQARLGTLRGRLAGQLGAGELGPGELEAQLDRLDADMYALETELAWRRQEMEAARASADKALRGWLLRRFAAGRRIESWSGTERGAVDSAAGPDQDGANEQEREP